MIGAFQLLTPRGLKAITLNRLKANEGISLEQIIHTIWQRLAPFLKVVISSFHNKTFYNMKFRLYQKLVYLLLACQPLNPLHNIILATVVWVILTWDF